VSALGAFPAPVKPNVCVPLAGICPFVAQILDSFVAATLGEGAFQSWVTV